MDQRLSLVAKVIVDVPTRALRAPFDYSVPPELAHACRVGVPVLVPLGGRPVVGWVTVLADTSRIPTLRPVEAVLGEAVFDEVSVRVAEWIAAEYVAPLSEALRLFLPPGGSPRARKTDAGWEIAPAGNRVAEERWAELTRPASEIEVPRGATMQRALVDALSAGPLRTSELSARLGGTAAPLRRLEEAGAVRLYSEQRRRGVTVAHRPAPRHENLTPGQEDALAELRHCLAARAGTVVIDGVTGSGKTEVYLRALEEVVADGGGGIVLVPEISLTPQTVGRFRTRFGDTVAVLHSRLGTGERYDEWRRVLNGEARVAVGARSAVFAPMPDLRLVIIDEEHEPSYKQGSAPRYDARSVAGFIARERGAVLVLGSATPRIETLNDAEEGRASLVRMPERVGGRPMPEVVIVDMTAEFAAGNRSMFSRALQTALDDVHERGEKAVLFLNRRGFASFLLCRECGFVPSCVSCSTSLTYHDVGARLVCHHCEAVSPVPPTCPECGSPYLRLFGAGTQRVETELANRFPGLAVVRMDADTTTGKGGHERALASFEQLDSGVLLGTQMVAKGLDYPEVTVVGVLNADTSLHLPDFRSGERTYQLLEQVAGRAGRGDAPGTVYVQTYWPDHAAVLSAAAHDPAALMAEELPARRALGFPPFGRLANVVVTSEDESSAASSAAAVASAASAAAPEGWEVVGPAPAPLARIRGSWRWHVLVKAPPDAAIGEFLDSSFGPLRPPDGVTIACDVDPVDLL